MATWTCSRPSELDDKIAWYENVGALNGMPTFVEGGPPVILDADVDVSDAEMDGFNAGNGNYDGASVTLVRNGGAASEDVFSFNDGNGITLVGGNLIKNSQIIASFDTTSTPGELVVSFTDANGEIPTSVDVDNILRQITYSNSSGTPPPSAPIDWTFDDGNTGAQGSGGALQAVGSTAVTIIRTLTSVTNAPSPNTAGDTSTHTVSFTTADPLPLDGKILVTFPAGFDLTAVGNADISSGTMDGSFSVSAAGQVLTITRSGGTAQPAAAENIIIADIINTSHRRRGLHRHRRDPRLGEHADKRSDRIECVHHPRQVGACQPGYSGDGSVGRYVRHPAERCSPGRLQVDPDR